MLRIFKQYYPIRNIFFVTGEGLVIYFSVILASFVLIDADLFHFDRWLCLKTLLITIVFLICLYYNDLYDLNVTDSSLELTIRLMQSLGVASILIAPIYFIFPEAIIGRGVFLISILFVIIFVASWRYCYWLVLRRGLFNEKIIMIGSSDLADQIKSEIETKKDSGYVVTLTVPDSVDFESACDEKSQAICQSNYSGLCEMAKQQKINKIIVALKERRGALPIEELLKCRVNGIEILEGNSFYEMLMGKLTVQEINPAWLIFSEGFKKSRLKRISKRLTDIFISLTLLIGLTPVILLTAIIIKLDSKGPVLFSQDRVGQNKRPYKIYKFRSMVTDAEKKSGPVWAQDNDTRITRVGQFIRKWRVDEIPQLWNVLKGEMSFVGPRPERDYFVKKLEEIIPYYRERFTVKPGLTGWAQVSYGYGASIEDAIEKLNYELFYIKNMSLFMDVLVVLRTVKTVIFGQGR